MKKKMIDYLISKNANFVVCGNSIVCQSDFMVNVWVYDDDGNYVTHTNLYLEDR